MITYEEIRKNEDIRTYIQSADEALAALGFTEHSFAHVTKVAESVKYILETLGFSAVFTNLFGNILIFVPYGFFISVASRMRGFLMTLFYSFGLSLGVEVFQLLTRVGSFDVDDLLLNTIGGILGYVLFLICNGIRRKYDGRRKKGKKGK